MAEIILQNDQWQIERQPGGVTDPMVVRFVKEGRFRRLLDQTARWTPTGWDPHRWMPQPPIVPAAIVAQVAGYMRSHAEDIVRREKLQKWSQERLAARQQEGEG